MPREKKIYRFELTHRDYENHGEKLDFHFLKFLFTNEEAKEIAEHFRSLGWNVVATIRESNVTTLIG
jgi:hypothetical protein